MDTLNIRECADSSSMFKIVGSLVDADHALSVANARLTNGAAMLFDWTLRIKNGNPQWSAIQIRNELKKAFLTEVNKFVAKGTIDQDWEKKCKDLNAPYKKLCGFLALGGDLGDSNIKSCNACEKWTTAENKRLAKVREDEVQQEAIKQHAKDTGMSEVEAAKAFEPQDTDDEDTTTVETQSKGGVSANDSPILQDNIDSHGFDQDLTAFLITIGERLNKIGAADEDKLRTLTQSINGKIDGTLRGLLVGEGSKGKANLYGAKVA